VKHTAGPWEVIGKQGTAIWHGNEIIAQMTKARTDHKQARADAELIALAPVMWLALVDAAIDLRGHSKSRMDIALYIERVLAELDEKETTE
jgi:hypothetical protein